MSFALEFYSLSWDALKAALTQRKPELLGTIADRQWSRLLADTDLGHGSPHLWPYPHDERSPYADPGPGIAEGLDEIAQAMAQQRPARLDPPEISDNAALVFAAVVRQLGTPLGAIRHDASVARDRDGALPIDFRAMFLNGVAGSCFRDHALGENLAARPLFALLHLDFLSWGGLTRQEIAAVVANDALPDAERRDEEWQAIAAFAEGWLDQLGTALRAAAAAGTDLVTLYLTAPARYDSVWEEIEDELPGRLFTR